jgi:hypothetical protein
MRSIPLQPDFGAWRNVAREALHAGFRPEDLDLQDATVPGLLALSLDTDNIPSGTPIPAPHTSKAFIETAVRVAVNRDPNRWNLLYRVLYGLQSDRKLLSRETHEDVSQLRRLEAQVHRDLHAMQAFVRFHKVLDPGDPGDRPVVLDEPIPIDPDPHAHHLVLEVPTPFGPVKTELEACPQAPDGQQDCEHFVAWYQPEHRIVPMAAPYFAERFGILRWTILTPEASVSWNPDSKQLIYGPGIERESAPSDGELESVWRTYYAGLFTTPRTSPAKRSRSQQSRNPRIVERSAS